MSFESVMFLAIVLSAVGVTVFKLRSEKPEEGPGSLDIIPDFSPAGDSPFQSFHHDSAVHSGCDGGVAHDGGTADCGHGGFDGSGHH